MGKRLVAYFSVSGITKKWANDLAKCLEADIYEIKPKVAYTGDDLDWMNKNSRSTIEMQDINSRPELADLNADISNYDVIYLGFPIWWYVAPHIVNTFLESYDFSNKVIVVFATAGSSGFGKTISALEPSVSKTTVFKEGIVLRQRVENASFNEFVKEATTVSPCGATCFECAKNCKGCFAIKGKVWWLEYTKQNICDLYDCCVSKNNHCNCGECDKFPCDFYKKGDPTKTKEENEQILQMQIEALTKKR